MAEEEKAKDKIVEIQGPVSYTYCRFKVNGKPRIMHMFGDVHVNQNSCSNQESISTDTIIKNTIQHYRGEKIIDVFVERGFGKMESGIGQTDDYQDHYDKMPYIEELFRRFERDGCFHRPRDARCGKKYQNARFHNIDFRQTLHADVLNFLNEHVDGGFKLSDQYEPKIQQLITWFREYNDEVTNQLEEVIQKNISHLNSLKHNPIAFSAYKLEKTNSYDDNLYSDKDRHTVIANVQNVTLSKQTTEYKKFLTNHLQSALQDYQTRIVAISKTLYYYADGAEQGIIDDKPRLKSLTLWVRYLFQNYLYSDIMLLIERLLYLPPQDIDTLFGNLEHINILINVFKPLENTFNFLGILFYSIKMEQTRQPKHVPYYEYLLLHSASKTNDPTIRQRLVELIKTQILPQMRAFPKSDHGKAFMAMSYLERLSNSMLVVSITSYLLDLYTLIRAIKSEDFSNIIGYVGAAHIEHQKSYIKLFENRGIITDVHITEIPPRQPRQPQQPLEINQCVRIPAKILGGIYYLPFEWIEIGQMHYIGTGAGSIYIGSVPIAHDLDKKRYNQNDFVSQDEYIYYKKMKEEPQQEFYLLIREIVPQDERETFVKGFVYAIEKHGFDSVREKLGDENVNIEIFKTGDKETINQLFQFRPKRKRMSIKKERKRSKSTKKRSVAKKKERKRSKSTKKRSVAKKKERKRSKSTKK